jgi:hypothetical protein
VQIASGSPVAPARPISTLMQTLLPGTTPVTVAVVVRLAWRSAGVYARAQ